MSTSPTRTPTVRRSLMLGCTIISAVALSACDDAGQFQLSNLMPKGKAASTDTAAPPTTNLVERDVEAPEVFSATDQGLWDGRPSLGGVWVAHPDVTDPERVIIRNTANGKFVIGALFRRERDLPGPKLQISSDAAAALSVLAGAPAPLNVTALRREEAPEPALAPAEPATPATETPAQTDAIAAPSNVSQTTLDPIAAAGAAIDKAPATPAKPTAAPKPTAAAAPAPKPVATPAPKPKASSLARPFVQLGIFSVEANAKRTAKQMSSAGLDAQIKRGKTNGKTFWRVVVGPAQSKSALNSLLKKVKSEGFSDAYAVRN